MNEKNSEEIGGLLDRAVEHYRAAEPRTGLEQRVLAGLQSAPPPAFVWHWRGAAVTAVATLIAVGTLYWALRSPSPSIVLPTEQPSIARTAPAETPEHLELSEPPAEPAFPQPAAPAPRPVSKKAPRGVKPVDVEVAAALPRRATFPSPRTLSPQEILLVRFLQAAPREVMASVAQPLQPLALEKLSVAKVTIAPLAGFIALNTEQGE